MATKMFAQYQALSWPLTREKLIASLVIVLLTLASPLKAGTPVVANNRQPAASEIYRAYCSVCHGDRGDGHSRASNSLNPPPRDFTSAIAVRELTREGMIVSVREGRPGTAMTAWKSQLNDTQIEAVVDFVRTTFMGSNEAASGTSSAHPSVEKLATSPPVNAALVMPAGLKGNAARGKRFYLANCATCHGANGDGNGPRAYFINPKPRNFLAADSRARLNRPALFYAVALGKQGTEMPAWDKVLSKQEIANVAEFVFADFIAPPNLPARANQ